MSFVRRREYFFKNGKKYYKFTELRGISTAVRLKSDGRRDLPRHSLTLGANSRAARREEDHNGSPVHAEPQRQ